MQLISGYQETYFLYCINSNLEWDGAKPKPIVPITETPSPKTKSPPQSPTLEDESDCDYLKADPIPTTTTTAKCPYAYMKKTTGTTWMTSRIIKCITPTPIKLLPTKPTTSEKPYSYTTTTTMKTSTDVFTKFAGCCNRPATWLTTTEKVLPVTYFPFEPEEINEVIEINDIKVATKGILILSSKVTEPPTTSPITYTPATNIITHIPTTDTYSTAKPYSHTTTSTLRTSTEIFTKLTGCCNRPATWLTTTEKSLPVSYFPFKPVENKDVIEKKENVVTNEDYLILNVTVTGSPITYPITYSPIIYQPNTYSPITYPPTIYPPMTDSPITYPTTTKIRSTDPITDLPTSDVPTTKKKKQKVVVIRIIRRKTTKDEPESTKATKKMPKIATTTIRKKETTTKQTSDKHSLKFETPTIPRNWWYPTLCPSNRCQRPMVWSTTKSRRHVRN